MNAPKSTDKIYQLHILSYDYVEAFGIEYFHTFSEAMERLEKHREAVKVSRWEIFKVELMAHNETEPK